MLTVAYGEATLDRSNVYRWYKMFSEGREDVNDEERAGRPSTSTKYDKINEVEKMILANRRITVREVAENLNISIGSCHSIFINDLGMRRVAAKFVPKLLNCDQKQHRMNITNEMLDSVRDDPNLLQRVITGDEAASDVSMHLYHSSRNVLYLGCVKLLFWVHVNFLFIRGIGNDNHGSSMLAEFLVGGPVMRNRSLPVQAVKPFASCASGKQGSRTRDDPLSGDIQGSEDRLGLCQDTKVQSPPKRGRGQ
ncbi:hypothetical protein LAZ67_11002994 [Cordylochernes scorpioides]|uniref:Mos1 transposase HTH domain-containing protein n=1 Tax=Cordylochernes scorpioides TaxID=51811 RepID=A0ABY6L3H4_9ARAC|nr:hypothetical protein LAZ67_11002994 [Cordylochernes scorpioides]